MIARCAAVLVAAVCYAAGFAAPVRAANADIAVTIAAYSDLLAREGSHLPTDRRRDLAQRILLLASYYQLDPRLLMALVTAESAWQPGARSPVGARGLGQLMPGTARSLDVDPLETYENLDGTARYLRRMIDRSPGADLRARERLALAAYNAGPAAVARYGGIPPFAETRAYVERVMALYDRFRREASDIDPIALLGAARGLHRPPSTDSAAPRDVVVVHIPAPNRIALATLPPFSAPPLPLLALRWPQRQPGSYAFARFHQLRGDLDQTANVTP